MEEFDGRCFKQEGRFSLCLTSVLVNAAEHSGAALGLLSSFCFLYADCSSQSCVNVSVLSTSVNSFFWGYLDKMGIATGTRFRHSDIGNYCMVCASRACYLLS